MKPLIVNGLIVGEYLGSNDREEDQTAALEMLRAKGIAPPPLVNRILGQADAFAYTANLAFKELVSRGPNKPLVAAPFVVNAAFSVELYLKTLSVIASGESPREHKLLDLYDALPDPRRAELCADTLRLAAEHGEGPQVQFRELIAMLNESFVRWRYVYEQERSGTIHLQQTLLVMHACRDVCVRAVRGKD